MYKIQIGLEVQKDIRKLKLSTVQIQKLKLKIEEIATNPLPKSEGGYGEPLTGSLRGLLKFRFDNDYRVVYQLIRTDECMKIVIIGLRSDLAVYRNAESRV